VRRNAQAAALKTRDFTICIESCDKVLTLSLSLSLSLSLTLTSVVRQGARELEPGDSIPSRHTYTYYAALLTKVLEIEPGDTKSLFRRALAR
jgi:hypothetical protein